MDAKCSKEEGQKDASASPSATNEKRRRFNLPRIKILRGKKLFSEIFKEGKYTRVRSFDTMALAAAHGNPQAAFATARRVRRAVDRNLIKRRLREAYRLECRESPARHLVFIGSEKVLRLDFHTLRQEMRQALLP